jgi:replicative DNA helicase
MIQNETSESEMANIYLVQSRMAKQMMCPVILMAQLNRNYTGGLPRPNHLRYCLPKDAKIMDADTGGYFTPEEVLLSKAKDHHVWSYNGQEIIPQTFFCQTSGLQQILKITTMSGYEIRCSDNHPLLTGINWTEAKNLKVGEVVAVTRKISPTKTISYSPERARLMGYMLGDGHMPARSKGETDWVEPDNIVVEDFETCLKNEFPTITTRKKWHRGAWKVSIVQKTHSAKVNDFSVWLEGLGIRGVGSLSRYVPQECFTWDDTAVESLLAGLVVSDGSVGKDGIITFSSYSHQLLLDVKNLLLRFGIIGRISGTNLHIANLEESKKFYQQIKLYGKKQLILEEALKVSKKHIKASRSELLPIEINEIVRKKGFTKLSKNRSLTKDRALSLFPNDPEIAYYANNSIWWDKIRSIEIEGFEETYDFSIPELHNFVVNGILTHNTSLAEALSWDIFMLYNPSTDFHAMSDEGTLPPVDGKGYLLAWKMRGGFRKTPGPLALQMDWNGKSSWGDTAVAFKLKG